MIQNIIGSQLTTENQNFETPSLVETRQGVSVLYKDHFLYSKYDPSKAILNIISNLSIPEYSIILIFEGIGNHPQCFSCHTQALDESFCSTVSLDKP